MFDEQNAERWRKHLADLGYTSWTQDQGLFGWGVWCEEAGLLFQTEQGVSSFLRVQKTLGRAPKGVQHG